VTGIGLTESAWIIALSEADDASGLRLWPGAGHRGDVLRLQDQGFGLEDSHIRLLERLDRLILVMALALFWAAFTGMWDAADGPTSAEKNFLRNGRETTPEPSLPSSPEASLRIQTGLQRSWPPPPRSGARGQTDSG
jgi:hypothetical protein